MYSSTGCSKMILTGTRSLTNDTKLIGSNRKERAFFSLFFNDISIPEVNDVFLYCIYIFDLPLQYLKTMARSKLQ